MSNKEVKMEDFKLHKDLENSSVFIKELKLCQVRLNFDGDLDWLVLVPKKEGLKDWCDLELEDQYQLTREIDHVCRVMKAAVKPDKLNVASLGNMCPQLHIHVICRFNDDRAWPGAVFGVPPREEFNEERVEFWKDKI